MERFYGFAGMTFRVTGTAEDMYDRDGVLAPFRTEATVWDHSLAFEVVTALPKPDGEEIFTSGHMRVFRCGDEQLTCVGSVAQSSDGAYMQVRRKGAHSRIQALRQSIPAGISPRLVLNALQAEHHLIQRGGFILHSSFIQWHDRAILFTAPSGTGKSTQAELWRTLRGAEIINGDRTAITPEPTGATAWGIPYCGTSGICRNAQLPIAAIVYLSQAPTTSIHRLDGLRAFRHIWEGCSVNVWDEDDVDQCVQTVMCVAEQVPVFHLACTPDETAVEALEKMLEMEVKQDV